MLQSTVAGSIITSASLTTMTTTLALLRRMAVEEPSLRIVLFTQSLSYCETLHLGGGCLKKTELGNVGIANTNAYRLR